MDDFFDYNDYYNELANYKVSPHNTIPRTKLNTDVNYPKIETYSHIPQMEVEDEKLFLYFIIILLVCVIIIMNMNFNKQIYKLTKKQIQVI